MSFIKLTNISKTYKLDKNKNVTVLNNINLSFPSSGLVAINGASGSGKSTLLNLIATFDKPSSGVIKIKGIKDLDDKKSQLIYRNQIIGVLFQNYHLIEDESVIYNVALPLLINGKKEKVAYKEAETLLKKINFNQDYYHKKVNLLSGGEKQRVALLRSLINSPHILLCDEPTGAIDSVNAKLVMDILKSVSKTKLIILVSHNDELIEQYANRIITLKDGKIIKDELIKKTNNGHPISKLRRKRSNFINHFLLKNLRKRRKRCIFSFISLSISLVSSFLVIGFSYGVKDSLKNASLNQFDLGTSTVFKEVVSQISGSSLSLSKVSRLNAEELNDYKMRHEECYFTPNYSYFVPTSLEVSFLDDKLTNTYYSPIYSFNDTYINKDLLILGTLPENDNLNEVIINKTLYNKLVEYEDDPLYSYLNLFYKTSSSYSLETGYEIKDEFVFNKKVLISGVVDDLNFLSTPKIYYSYKALSDYLYTYPLNNLSEYLSYEISVAERVNNTYDSDVICSYSHYAFLKDVSDYEFIKINSHQKYDDIVFENQAYIKYQTLINLGDVISVALIIFLVIALIGSVLISGIITFASFSEDLKDSAILSSLGASNDDIASIYISENIIISLLSFVFSLFSSLGLQCLFNIVISRYSDFINVINIPLKSFNNIRLIVPLISLLIVILTSFISTYFPISLSKKISISKELAGND